jgi:hypothetical protein
LDLDPTDHREEEGSLLWGLGFRRPFSGEGAQGVDGGGVLVILVINGEVHGGRRDSENSHARSECLGGVFCGVCTRTEVSKRWRL